MEFQPAIRPSTKMRNWGKHIILRLSFSLPKESWKAFRWPPTSQIFAAIRRI